MFVLKTFPRRKESIGKKESGSESDEGHEGGAAALAGEDGFARDPLVEDGVNLASGDEDDDSVGHKDGAWAAGETGEKIGVKSDGEGTEKDSGEHAEVAFSKGGAAEGNEDGKDTPSDFFVGDVEGDSQGKGKPH